MQGFEIVTPDQRIIRFNLYLEEAPVTCAAFQQLLPFTRTLFHARVSGQEIWADAAPELHIIQENASVFTIPGEVVYGPARPMRVKTANCIGIYYGEGRGLDAANIFAKVRSEDENALKELGKQVWKHGAREIIFRKSEV